MSDPTFRTPEEWRRAREALIDSISGFMWADGEDMEILGNFDRLYPCPPEPAPSDAEAVLDAYVDAVRWLRGWALNRDSTRPSEEQIATTRAAVLARMQPVGEVMEIVGHHYHTDGRPALTVAGLYGEQFQTGQRVRVTRVEEAP